MRLKTAEIFVEQLLVGAMVVLMLALPFYPLIVAAGLSLSEHANVEKPMLLLGSLAAGAAYLLGVVADRVADTLCEGLDRRQRTEFAIKKLSSKRIGTAYPPEYECVAAQAARFSEGADLFAEGRFRRETLTADGGRREYADYLRSRIRLARSMAVFLPGIAFGWARCCDRGHDALLSEGSLSLVYGCGLVLALWWQREPERVPGTKMFPELLTFARTEGLCRCHEHQRSLLWLSSRRFWNTCWQPVTLVGIALALAGLWNAVGGRNGIATADAVILVLLVNLLALVSGWAWLRISRTFRNLLAND